VERDIDQTLEDMENPPMSLSDEVDSHIQEKEHKAVLIMALMAISNLVNDYAPFREV
jgi:hypothetical protein